MTTGDSDSTAAICGNNLGSGHGVHAIPEKWLADLEPRVVIEQLTLDTLAEFGVPTAYRCRPDERYPGW